MILLLRSQSKQCPLSWHQQRYSLQNKQRTCCTTQRQGVSCGTHHSTTANTDTLHPSTNLPIFEPTDIHKIHTHTYQYTNNKHNPTEVLTSARMGSDIEHYNHTSSK